MRLDLFRKEGHGKLLSKLFSVLVMSQIADSIAANGHLIQLHPTTSSRPLLKNYSFGT
jgi:hypothetical protein